LKVEKIIITDITPEELPAVLEALRPPAPSIMDEFLSTMGLGFGASLPMMLEKWAQKENNIPKTDRINKVPITLTADAIEAEGGLINICYTRPDFSGPMSCQMPAAKCPPVAQLKKDAKLLMVFKGRGKPFEEDVLGIELPKREKNAPVAGETDKDKP
jgi:hypothetical protein